MNLQSWEASKPGCFEFSRRNEENGLCLTCSQCPGLMWSGECALPLEAHESSSLVVKRSSRCFLHIAEAGMKARATKLKI